MGNERCRFRGVRFTFGLPAAGRNRLYARPFFNTTYYQGGTTELGELRADDGYVSAAKPFSPSALSTLLESFTEAKQKTWTPTSDKPQPPPQDKPKTQLKQRCGS